MLWDSILVKQIRQEIRVFVRQLEVVNDCAERGVKLIFDFKDICQTEEQQAVSMSSLEKSDLDHLWIYYVFYVIDYRVVLFE